MIIFQKKVLDKIKKLINIEKFGGATTLIKKYDKVLDDITFKTIAMVIMYITKNMVINFIRKYFQKKYQYHKIDQKLVKCFSEVVKCY